MISGITPITIAESRGLVATIIATAPSAMIALR